MAAAGRRRGRVRLADLAFAARRRGLPFRGRWLSERLHVAWHLRRAYGRVRSRAARLAGDRVVFRTRQSERPDQAAGPRLLAGAGKESRDRIVFARAAVTLCRGPDGSAVLRALAGGARERNSAAAPVDVVDTSGPGG